MLLVKLCLKFVFQKERGDFAFALEKYLELRVSGKCSFIIETITSFRFFWLVKLQFLLYESFSHGSAIPTTIVR